MNSRSLALGDVIVIDFGWILAAPVTSKFLADLGATVIRVESVHKLDGIRTTPPFRDNRPGIDRSGYFAMYNPNKYSMALNLKHPKAVGVAKRLIAKSDVVIENFVPGAMKRLGLDYENLAKIKPDIIMLSLSMLGQTGPYAKHLGFGIQLTGLTGFTHITGWPDRDPVQPYAGVTDACAPNLAAGAVIAALIHRRKTGKGQYLDMSQNEASIQYLSPLCLITSRVDVLPASAETIMRLQFLTEHFSASAMTVGVQSLFSLMPSGRLSVKSWVTRNGHTIPSSPISWSERNTRMN